MLKGDLDLSFRSSEVGSYKLSHRDPTVDDINPVVHSGP